MNDHRCESLLLSLLTMLALVGLAPQAAAESIQSQTEGVVAAYEADPSKENLQRLK